MANIGATLRDARVKRGLTVEQVAQETRISNRFLQALEAEQFDALPAPVYVRGFLRSYANFLRLDPAPLLVELDRVPAMREAVSRHAEPPPGGRAAPQRPADPFARATAPRTARGTVDGRSSGSPALQPQPVPGADPRSYPEPPEDEAYQPDEFEEAPTDPDDRNGGRWFIIFGAGLVAVLVGLGAAVFMTNDDGNQSLLGATGTSTATGTASAIASPSPTSSVPRATPTAPLTSTPSGTPDGSATPTATAMGETPTAGATVTQGARTATPTFEAANTPTPSSPTPTPTSAPPTPTATSTVTPTRTATRTPGIPHPSGYQECPVEGGGTNCGVAPFRVICPPDDDWFLDYNRDFVLPSGWRAVDVQTTGRAPDACG